MRHLTLLLFIVGCGGPQQRYADTPTAQTKYQPTLAPAASDNEREREQLVMQFEDMRAGQLAHEEANRPSAPPGPPPPGASPPPPAPKGTAPATTTTIGTAEQGLEPPRL